MQSGGDLENEENIANIFLRMLQYATKVPLSADDSQNCKRISGNDKVDTDGFCQNSGSKCIKNMNGSGFKARILLLSLQDSVAIYSSFRYFF